MYALIYYIPPVDHERVKQALFARGAGKIGHYDQACWQVLGTGQFRPLAGSHPATGKQARLEQLEEFRVEMVCDEEHIKKVVETLLKEHPYEQPAWQVHRIIEPRELGR